jgi:hypothetical protein
MNEKETAAKTRAQFLRDAFEGIKGRQPMSDDELNQWLATDEGRRRPYLMTRLYRLGASGGGPNNALLRVVTAEGPTARLQRWGDPASSASKRKSRHNSTDVARKLIREEGKNITRICR